MGGLFEALALYKSAKEVLAEGKSLLEDAKAVKGWLTRSEEQERGLAEPARLHRYPIGRQNELRDIYKALDKTGRVAVLKGMGGVGKSTLARMFVSQHGKRYDEVAWLNAETVQSLAEGLAAKGPRIKGFDLPPGATTVQAKTVLEALPKNWLLVYDNAPDLKTVREYMPPMGRCDVLVTSRHQKWGGFTQVEPPVLSTENVSSDGVRLLIQEAMTPEDWAQVPAYDDPEARLGALVEMVERADRASEAVSLARAMGGLPLGLVIVGALIREEGGTFAEWETRIGEVMVEEEGTDYTRTITAAVGLSYDLLEPDARSVVDLFAWYAPEGLDAGLLTDVPGSERLALTLEPISDDLRALCSDTARVNTALRELVTRSLLTRDGASFEMHRLTAEAIRGLQGNRRLEVSGAAAAVLAAAYPGGGRAVVSEIWPACARLTPHVLAYRRAVGAAAPALAAVDFLYNQAAVFLDTMANYRVSQELMSEAHSLKLRLLPESHSSFALATSNVGMAALKVGDYKRAFASLHQALNLCETYNHPVDVQSVCMKHYCEALRQWYINSGDRSALIQAKNVHEKCLAEEQNAFGPGSVEVANSYLNLASTLDLLGERTLAIEKARVGLAIERALPNENKERVGGHLFNLGAYLLEEGNSQEAADVLSEAFLNFNQLPSDHPMRVHAASWLCSAYLKLGRRAEGRDLADAFGLDLDERQRMAAQYPDPR